MDVRLSAMDRLALSRLTADMTTNPVPIVTAAASVSSAAVGGLFYAFSAFVMRGLDRTGPVDAITEMRGINAEAERNAPLLGLLFGSALLALMRESSLSSSGASREAAMWWPAGCSHSWRW
jgi:uncharacterized membrane protein